ncbi:MAG TPA: hypothetical protein DCP90_00145 [Clostridiales bacterium]|nr:MAG: hypothetical protein A2Y22_02540 [Clostridiales bacterium GWD2_32_59]HAN09005.1 hypothetical protein [Clostridiales bacterium]
MVDSKSKIISVGVIFTLIFFFLLCKVGYIQIVKGEEYQKMAILQQVTKMDKEIKAVRGSILDRNNYELAISRRVYDIVIDNINFARQKEDDKKEQISKMSQILDIPLEEIKEMIKQDTHYKVLKKNVTKEIVDKMREDELKNLIYEEAYKRKYVYGDFASNIIGFANEITGLIGIESQYDSYLKGTQGRKFITFKGNDMLVQDQIEAKNGYNIVMSIDKNIQVILENKLKEAVDIHKPKNASIIAMEPNTGEILGLATYPNFNLNDPMKLIDEQSIKKLEGYEDRSIEEKLNILWRNYAINDAYEPGSVFKAITVAIGLEEIATNVNDTFFCTGYKVVTGTKLECDETHGHETLEEALANSCNVAMMDIAERLGKEKFYYYQKLFGFGQFTGIDINGESRGMLHKVENVVPTNLATDSFGQGFTVTPIQMITAFASVINGGNLMKPHLVSQIVDNDMNVIVQNNPVIVRKTISKETSDVVRMYLEKVVTEGTGSKVYMEGYRIGGKTGTSEKLPRGNHKYVASFMAFAPVDNPKIILLVIVDEPSGGSYYGGTVAAPTAKNCLEEILKYMVIPKVESDITTTKVKLNNQMLMLSDYTGQAIVDVIMDLNKQGIKHKIVGSGSKVENQVPKGNTLVPLDREVLLYMQGGESMIAVPNLIGKTYTEVTTILTENSLKLKEGSGGGKLAIEQIPAAGTKVDADSEVYVKFR